jgi:hypothetical protein
VQTQLAQTQIDGKWWQVPEVTRSARQQENDYQWRWAKRVGELVNDRWHEAVAVQLADGSIEGAIVYWTNTRSFVDPEQGAVYVEALATAPRNRSGLVPTPEHRGVGEGLLIRSVVHSYLLGLGGRVNLTSFDDPRTVQFYQNRGFSMVGYDGEDDERLPRLELDSDAAITWLREEGYEYGQDLE